MPAGVVVGRRSLSLVVRPHRARPAMNPELSRRMRANECQATGLIRLPTFVCDRLGRGRAAVAGMQRAVETARSSEFVSSLPNKTTAPNAGGPRRLPMRTRSAARVGEFCR